RRSRVRCCMVILAGSTGSILDLVEPRSKWGNVLGGTENLRGAMLSAPVRQDRTRGANMSFEPARRESGHTLERARFFEQMSCAADDFERHLSAHVRHRVAIHRNHRPVF